MYKHDVPITPAMLQEVHADIPTQLKQALDPTWLSGVLTHISAGSAILSLDFVEEIKAMAAKVRIAVSFENAPDKVYRLCIKGFLDYDLASPAANITALREALFYSEIGPHLGMRVPPCAAVVINRDTSQAILVMGDMIAAGDHFYNALQPLTVAQTAETLEQLARLHAKPELLEGRDWIPNRLNELVTRKPFISWEEIQTLMHDGRGEGLPARTLDAANLKSGLQALASTNADLPATLLHGDCHPGNIYSSHDGKLGFTDWQLIQRGHWSTDVAYHIASVLPIELAEQEERNLLNHYVECLQTHGGESLNKNIAWEQYRKAVVYGYFHWAVTRRVEPSITREAFGRLGAAITRLDSYTLLGL